MASTQAARGQHAARARPKRGERATIKIMQPEHGKGWFSSAYTVVASFPKWRVGKSSWTDVGPAASNPASERSSSSKPPKSSCGTKSNQKKKMYKEAEWQEENKTDV